MTDRSLFRAGLAVLVASLVALALIFVALADDAHGQPDPRTRSTRNCDFDLARPEVAQVSNTGVLRFRLRYGGRGSCHAEVGWQTSVVRESFRAEVYTANGWQVYSATPSTITDGCQQPNWCFTDWRTASDPCSYIAVPTRIYRTRGRWEFRSVRTSNHGMEDTDTMIRYSAWSQQWPCGLHQ